MNALRGAVAAAALLALASGAATADPAWQPIASPSTPREAFVLAAGPSGVYAIGGGGCRPGCGTTSVERYDPASGTWQPRAPLPDARVGAAGVETPDGRVWVLGGYSDGCSCTTADVEVYDPNTDSWAPGPALPAAREFAGATADEGGAIYVVGGTDASGQTLDSVVELYPPHGAWIGRKPLPERLAGLGVTTIQHGDVITIGGYTDSPTGRTYSPHVYLYEPASDEWSSAPSLPAGRGNLAAVATAGDHVLAIGGFVVGGGPASTSVEVLLPGAFAWQPGPTLGTPRAALGAGLAPDGFVYAVGGYTGSGIAGAERLDVRNAPDTTPPTAPTDLAADAATVAVRLSWTASHDDVGVTGYDIARSGTTLATGVAATSFVDTSATPGSDVVYSVRARDAAGNLSTPATLAVHVPQAEATTGKATDVGETAATLTGIVVPHGLSGTWRFEWGRNGTFGRATAAQPLPAGAGPEAVAATLNLLRPATRFSYRLAITTGAGTVLGRTATFTTRRDTIPPLVVLRNDGCRRTHCTGPVGAWRTLRIRVADEASPIAVVRLRLLRHVHGHCLALTRHGFRRASCAGGPWLSLPTHRDLLVRLHGLTAGSYTLTLEARDAAGNWQRVTRSLQLW
jgi:hypothetical protein